MEKQKPFKKPVPKIVVQIVVDSNNNILVNNFPQNYNQAIGLMQAATAAVTNYFIEKAKKGDLLDSGDIRVSNILTPGGGIVVPGRKG